VFAHHLDIIAQAVSRARATQTGQWHSHNKPSQDPVYEADGIAISVRSIAIQVEQMRRFAEVTGRPHTQLLYEDIAKNGLSAAQAAGDILGAPRRKSQDDSELLRPIEKMGDAINDEWKERFLKEMDASVREVVEAYIAAIDHGTPPPWTTSEEGSRPKIQKTQIERGSEFDAVLAKFPDETAALVRSAVDTRRASFPTGACLILDEVDKSRQPEHRMQRRHHWRGALPT